MNTSHFSTSRVASTLGSNSRRVIKGWKYWPLRLFYDSTFRNRFDAKVQRRVVSESLDEAQWKVRHCKKVCFSEQLFATGQMSAVFVASAPSRVLFTSCTAKNGAEVGQWHLRCFCVNVKSYVDYTPRSVAFQDFYDFKTTHFWTAELLFPVCAQTCRNINVKVTAAHLKSFILIDSKVFGIH